MKRNIRNTRSWENCYVHAHINTIGELLNWYKLSDLVIMGGTFIGNMGGHNILEAIYFKKAVIVGRYMYNFIEIYEYMKESVFNCKEKENLPEVIKLAYENKELREKLANSAYTNNNGQKKGHTHNPFFVHLSFNYIMFFYSSCYLSDITMQQGEFLQPDNPLHF